jgi:cobyrinic acid a,c-diamide synthase
MRPILALGIDGRLDSEDIGEQLLGDDIFWWSPLADAAVSHRDEVVRVPGGLPEVVEHNSDGEPLIRAVKPVQVRR